MSIQEALECLEHSVSQGSALWLKASALAKHSPTGVSPAEFIKGSASVHLWLATTGNWPETGDMAAVAEVPDLSRYPEPQLGQPNVGWVNSSWHTHVNATELQVRAAAGLNQRAWYRPTDGSSLASGRRPAVTFQHSATWQRCLSWPTGR